MTSTTDNDFDIGILVERLDGDEEIAREVAVAFVESLNDLVAQLDTAVGDGAAAQVRLHAHSIKGAAGNVGANGLAETAATIEYAGRDNELEIAVQAMPTLKRQVEHVLGVLEAW